MNTIFFCPEDEHLLILHFLATSCQVQNKEMFRFFNFKLTQILAKIFGRSFFNWFIWVGFSKSHGKIITLDFHRCCVRIQHYAQGHCSWNPSWHQHISYQMQEKWVTRWWWTWGGQTGGAAAINSGQIIATSHDLTPNGGLVRNFSYFREI